VIGISQTQVKEAQYILSHIKDGAKIAAMRAINRTIDGVKSDAAKQASSEYIVKQKTVKDTMKTSKATANNLSARVTSRGKSIPLIDFKVSPSTPQPTRRPILKVQVKRGSAKTAKGLFVQRGQKSGRLNVFSRIGKSRYPIKTHYGPAIPLMIGAKTVKNFVETNANKRLAARLDHEVQFLLDTYK